MEISSKINQHNVASGSYEISKKQNGFLYSYLGSCVGVTLCDKKAGVGGLIHLLLPEPTGTGYAIKKEIYAATGMPLFIDALCNMGAEKKRLEATIAGGSLVGPLSQEDLDLDIGGRTTDVVNSILQEEGIKINKTETGGFFSCKLILDLKTLKSSMQPIADTTPYKEENIKKINRSEILHAIDLVRPIPQIALKIIRMIQEKDYNMPKIAREVKQDQIISAKVIKLCNSSFFGLKKSVYSIDRALVILGEKLLMQLILSASFELYFSDSEGGYSLCRGGLFQHAFGTAMAAEQLARFSAGVAPDIAYTAGLMHDIGKVVLDQYLAAELPLFYRRTQIEGIELCELEGERFGITHPEAGGILAEKWGLPENLADAIIYHHQPEHASIDPKLTHLIYVADLIMSRFHVGQELERLNTNGLPSRLKQIGLSSSQLPTIIGLISQKISNDSSGMAYMAY